MVSDATRLVPKEFQVFIKPNFLTINYSFFHIFTNLHFTLLVKCLPEEAVVLIHCGHISKLTTMLRNAYFVEPQFQIGLKRSEVTLEIVVLTRIRAEKVVTQQLTPIPTPQFLCVKVDCSILTGSINKPSMLWICNLPKRGAKMALVSGLLIIIKIYSTITLIIIRSINESEMSTAIRMLTGGSYKLQNRNQLPKLVNEIFEVEREEMFKEFSRKYGTLMLDGWTTISNVTPGIVSTLFATPASWHLLDSKIVDDQGSSAQVLLPNLLNNLNSVEANGGKIVAFVSDNEKKMVLLREMLLEQRPEMAVFGCSAHLMDLVLEKFVKTCPKWSTFVDRVLDIQIQFRVHRFKFALMKNKGALAPIKPAETRFHSNVDVVEIFRKTDNSIGKLCWNPS